MRVRPMALGDWSIPSTEVRPTASADVGRNKFGKPEPGGNTNGIYKHGARQSPEVRNQSNMSTKVRPTASADVERNKVGKSEPGCKYESKTMQHHLQIHPTPCSANEVSFSAWSDTRTISDRPIYCFRIFLYNASVKSKHGSTYRRVNNLDWRESGKDLHLHHTE